jgi:hypothetical protein
MSSPSPARLTLRERAMRRNRVFARLLEGQTAVAVAAEEGVASEETTAFPPLSHDVAEAQVLDRETAAAKEIIPLRVENPRPAQIPAIFVTHFSRS